MAMMRPSDASSSLSSQFSYDIFLSFRGKDTGKTFTDYLYTALVGAGLNTFRDTDGIERGEDIKSQLQEAIIRSRSAIVVLSKDYAGSTWCLDELVLILQRRKTTGLIVIPIFYDVYPSNVRYQTKSLHEAFVRNEEQFKGETNDKRRACWMNKVAGWRKALTEVANLSGLVLKNEADGYESKFIQKVVGVIDNKLTCNDFYVAPFLVGVDYHVENINLLLRNRSDDVSILGICGMGGIGKTTIAKSVFNVNFRGFECSSFLENVSEGIGLPDGLVRLQRKLLSDLLKQKIKKIKNVDDGLRMIRSAVSRGRVLIVFDDVNQKSDLNLIFRVREWVCPGSKIIITARDLTIPKVHDASEIYLVKNMDSSESLELFSWHAFRDGHPPDDYSELSQNLVMCCQGLPLALQLSGSSLHGQSVDVWRRMLDQLKTIPQYQIVDMLKISFDLLPTEHDKDLFLDIACFFCGKNEADVIMILDDCNYPVTAGIETLKDRCLLTVDKDSKIRMHQMLQGLGREIIWQESPRDPGKRSRLWHSMDSLTALREDSASQAIKGLALNIRKQESYREPSNINNKSNACLKTDAFRRMKKLRLLEINYVQLTGGYKDFPKNLSWLCWHGCPLKSLTCRFPLDNLVAIDMKHSNLEKFWMGNKCLGFLKLLNLSHCRRLIETPDFSKLPALKKLVLKDCVSLVEVDESIGFAQELSFLNLRDCKSLKKLPNSISMLKYLKTLIISGCSNLNTSTAHINQLLPVRSRIISPQVSAQACSGFLSQTATTRMYQRVGRSSMVSSTLSKNIVSPTPPVDSISWDIPGAVTKVKYHDAHVDQLQSNRVCDPSQLKPRNRILFKRFHPPVGNSSSRVIDLKSHDEDKDGMPPIHDIPSQGVTLKEIPPTEEIVRLVPFDMAGGQECSTSDAPSLLLPTSSKPISLNLDKDDAQRIALFSTSNNMQQQNQVVCETANPSCLAFGDGSTVTPPVHPIDLEGFCISQEAQSILKRVKARHPDFLSGFLVKYGPYQQIFLEDLAGLLTVISSTKIRDITPALLENVIRRVNDMVSLGIDLKFLQNRLNDIHECSSLHALEVGLIENDQAIAELEHKLFHLGGELKTRQKTRAEGAKVIQQVEEMLSPLDPHMFISQHLF